MTYDERNFEQKPDIKFVKETWNTVEAALLELAFDIGCCQNHLKWIDFYIKKLRNETIKRAKNGKY